MFRFFSSRSFAPKESTILRTKLYPKRIGVSRLYVTYISDDVCSLTQSIPLEIILEPIKQQDKSLLKTNTETPIETDEKSEKKILSPINNQDKSSIKEDEQKQPLTKIEEEISSNNLQTKSDDEDEDEDLYLKKKQNNNATNSSVPHGSTLSLDKDKMSVDSLDISNDRRQTSNNNQ